MMTQVLVALCAWLFTAYFDSVWHAGMYVVQTLVAHTFYALATLCSIAAWTVAVFGVMTLPCDSAARVHALSHVVEIVYNVRYLHLFAATRSASKFAHTVVSALLLRYEYTRRLVSGGGAPTAPTDSLPPAPPGSGVVLRPPGPPPQVSAVTPAQYQAAEKQATAKAEAQHQKSTLAAAEVVLLQHLVTEVCRHRQLLQILLERSEREVVATSPVTGVAATEETIPAQELDPEPSRGTLQDPAPQSTPS